jgi:transcription initiation factor IIF auxiliary subunit
MWTKKKHDYDMYEWCVFVDDDLNVLDRIEWVEYTLHPTFPDPVRKVSDRSNRFVLMSSGWGSFDVGVLVHFVDGTEIRETYFLELTEDGWPRKSTVMRELDEQHARVYSELPDGTKNRWKKLSTIAKATGMREEHVTQILGDLENNNLARKAFFKSIEGEDLWGSTRVVGITPRVE